MCKNYIVAAEFLYLSDIIFKRKLYMRRVCTFKSEQVEENNFEIDFGDENRSR